MPFNLLHRALLTNRRIELRACILGRRLGRLSKAETEPLSEFGERVVRSRANRPAALAGDQNRLVRFIRQPNARKLGRDAFVIRRLPVTLVTCDLWHGRVFDDELARPDQPCDIGVAEALAETPNVAINRLGPQTITRIEITTDQ